MAIDDVPRELRDVAQEILAELKLASGIAGGTVTWLHDYDVLELRAEGYVEGQDLEVYLPRPLVEDIASLGLASRKELLEDLRCIPGRARGGEGRFWVLREQGRAGPLGQRPFL